MSVKLVVFKTGEQIICDIKEGFDVITDPQTGEEHQKMITYLLEKPCSISVNGRYSISNEDGDKKDHMSISLTPWPRFSEDTIIPVMPSFVVAVTNPTTGLKEMYMRQILNENDKCSSLDEQQNLD
jgi:hypothetical protein